MNRWALFWGGLLFVMGVVLLLDRLNLFASLNINIGGVILAILLIGLGIWLIWSILAKPQGTASIRVLENAAAQICVEGGLMDAQVDRNRFPRSGSLYRSEGFETAENQADLDIEGGAGSVKIW